MSLRCRFASIVWKVSWKRYSRDDTCPAECTCRCETDEDIHSPHKDGFWNVQVYFAPFSWSCPVSFISLSLFLGFFDKSKRWALFCVVVQIQDSSANLVGTQVCLLSWLCPVLLSELWALSASTSCVSCLALSAYIQMKIPAHRHTITLTCSNRRGWSGFSGQTCYSIVS